MLHTANVTLVQTHCVQFNKPLALNANVFQMVPNMTDPWSERTNQVEVGQSRK